MIFQSTTNRVRSATAPQSILTRHHESTVIDGRPLLANQLPERNKLDRHYPRGCLRYLSTQTKREADQDSKS